MTTTTFTNPAVSEFAAAVRAHLADLSADEVDDLTDGLEADLAERAEDADAPALGDPLAYADELRAAAGMPARGHTGRGNSPRPGGIFTRAHWSRLATEAGAEFAAVRANPIAATTIDFLVAIRPFWWVLRGWVGYQVLSFVLGVSWGPGILPTNGFAWLMLIAVVVVSVQWGRGKWLPFTWMKVTFLVASTVAALIAIPVAFGVAQSAAYAQYAAAADDCCSYAPDGLLLNGSTVSNIFAYDANGEQIDGVQLFDQSGNPLGIMSDSTAQYTKYFYTDSSLLVPNPAASGHYGWNVFPLAEVPQSALNDDGTLSRTYTPKTPAAPFTQVQPLVQEEETSPTPTATPAPEN